MRLGRTAVAAAVVVLAACTSSGPSPSSWTALGPGTLGAGTVRLVHAAGDGRMLIGVGSLTVDGSRVPGIWRTTDGERWQRLDTAPRSITGVRSELTAVAAARDGTVAAIGQTTGGTHGNPRVGTWSLDGTTLTEHPGDVELYGGPRQGSVNEMAAGPAGFVVMGTRTDRNERTGAASWTSPDAQDTFTIHDADPALESAPGEIVRSLAVAGNGHGYLAAGDRFVSGTGRLDSDALFWTSTDGAIWARLDIGAVAAGPGSELAQVATAWRDGWAVAGTDSAGGRTSVVVWTSTDGTAWHRAAVDVLGSDPDGTSAVTSLAVAGDRLVVGARLGTRLGAAESSDGQSWSALALPDGMPTGPHAVVVAAPAGDRLVLAATGEDTSTQIWSRPAD
jgi:hypothetical protein